MNWRALGDAGAWTYIAWVAYAAAFGLAVWFYVKSGDRSTVFLLCAMVLSVIFAFGAKMHERYLYPAIALLLAAYAVDRDARILGTAIMLSASVFLNGALVLEDQWLMNSRVPSVIVAVLNTAAAPMLVWTGWDICLRRRYLNADKLLEREKQVAESARISGAKTPILRAAGLEDEHYLSRQFKRYTGMSARQYRAAHVHFEEEKS